MFTGLTTRRFTRHHARRATVDFAADALKGTAAKFALSTALGHSPDSVLALTCYRLGDEHHLRRRNTLTPLSADDHAAADCYAARRQVGVEPRDASMPDADTIVYA